jgi:hypothetical protein
VFASVANDGRVEIWDLAKDSISPQVCHFDKDAETGKLHTPKTIVKFSRTLPVIFTGDTQGRVHAYRTYGLDHE